MKLKIYLIALLLIEVCQLNIIEALADRPHRVLPPPSCNGSTYPPLENFSSLKSEPILKRSANPVTIDLLVAYTPDALARVGNSSTAMSELIRRILAYTNAAHSNSETGVTFSVVYIHPLTTNAADNFSSDLSSASFSDGVWDELQTLRETYKSDIVSVLVGGTQGGTICGLGYTNGISGSLAQSSPYMYNIVSIAPSCSFATITHELGHNLGCSHDRANATSAGFQPFSYGYSFTGKSRNVFHTVMATTSNIEIPFFSSPLLTYEETPIGVLGSEDNAQSLSLAASTVASYYTSLNGENLALPIPESPTKISTKTKRSKTKITLTYKLLAGNAAVPFAPIHAYYSRGKRGKQFLRSFGKTNSQGIFKFQETSRIAKGYYYKACYLGSSRTRLCSANLELASVK